MTTTTYQIRPTWRILNDAPAAAPLATLFRDSHTMFKLRVQKLGRVSQETTREDTETLRLMLEILIETKQKLRNQA